MMGEAAGLPMIAATVIAFALTALSGFFLIPMLRALKIGQTILDIGPNWHKNKEGTPTMGGVMFVLGIVPAVLAGYFLLWNNGSLPRADLMRILTGLVMAVAFGGIGFLDDFIKVVKKRNLGLTAKQKLLGQFVVSGLYVLSLYIAGDTSTIVQIPFLGQWNLGLFYYPIMILGITYVINAVNLNDGIDGLCSSVTFISALGYLAAAALLYMPGMSMFAGALAGGSLGFLLWNFRPAKVFMGDTGSFFFGGCVVAVAFGLGLPAYLLLFGMIYILEALSVLIQTSYFKLTRRLTGTPKRLFKMSPIHHHYEMCGWSEGKICVVFSLVQAVSCLLAIAAIRLL